MAYISGGKALSFDWPCVYDSARPGEQPQLIEHLHVHVHNVKNSAKRATERTGCKVSVCDSNN